MDQNALAQKIHDALAQKKDGHGAPTPISNQTKNYAAGIVAALKAATFSNLPGTITGVTAPGSPLSGGAGIGGVIVITPAPMIAKSGVGLPPQAVPNVAKENTALIQYIGTGLVTFAAGKITGTCTNSPTSPGPLAAGAGTDGMITGLTGAGAVAAVSAALGSTGPDMLKHYDAVINYLLQNAIGTYSSGSVTGTCPAGGGPLTLGSGIGGTFS